MSAHESAPVPFDEVLRDLRQNKEFRKAERQVAPYFDLALAVIKRRLELGLTQADLAELANTYQSRISKIESGEHDIRLSTLISIAEALRCQVSKSIIVPIDASEYIQNEAPVVFQGISSKIQSAFTAEEVQYTPIETYQYT